MKKESLIMLLLPVFLILGIHQMSGQTLQQMDESIEDKSQRASLVDVSQIWLFPYPEACRNDGIQGSVSMKLLINESGHVLRMAILDSPHQAFSEVCKNRMSTIKFHPALDASGNAIASWLHLKVRFELDD